MPRVAGYEPNQVETRPLAGVERQGLDASAFGTGIADGAQRLAQVTGQVAGEIQDQADESRARALGVEYAEFERATLYGTTNAPGYFSLSGQDAIDAQAKTAQVLKDKADALRALGKTTRQQDMFGAAVDRQLAGSLDGIAQHGVTAVKQFRRATTGATVKSAVDYAASSYSNPTTQDAWINTAKAATLDALAQDGLDRDPASKAAALLETTTAIHAAALGQMIDRDPVAAKAYFDKYEADIDPAQRGVWGGRIQAQAAQVKALSQADEIMARFGDDQAGAYAAAAKLPPQERLVVEPRLANQYARKEQIKKAADSDLWSNAQVQIAGGADPMTFDSATRTALAAAGVWDAALSFHAATLSGTAPVKNGPVYTRLMTLAALDPAAFRDVPITEFAGSMPNDEFLDVVKAQSGAKAAWSVAALPTINRAVAMILPQAQTLDPKKKPEDQRRQREQIQAFVVGEVNAARQAKHDVTDEDIKGWANRAMLTLDKGDDKGKRFYESGVGELWVNRRTQYESLRVRAEPLLGRPLDREEIKTMLGNLDSGKPMVRAKDIPASFLPKSRVAMSPKQLEDAYKAYLLQ